ncbi:MAG: ABC transporter ATP-binding protein [Actinomycetota bacterium]
MPADPAVFEPTDVLDGEARVEPASPPDDEVDPELSGAWQVLKRGLRETPEMRVGLWFTVALALVMTVGQLLIPILIQQIVDHGLGGEEGFRPWFVGTVCGIGAVATLVVYLTGRAAFGRMITASENALCSLRIRAFDHIHRLSIADQTAEKRGTYVARVTADIETIAQFLDWGGMSWILGTALMVGTAALMFVYSWQLALITLFVVAPLGLVLRLVQRGQARAYDRLRTRVSQTMSEVSESVMGAAVVRAYGLHDRMDRRLKTAIGNQYRAQLHANRYQATIFPLGDLFGAAAVAAVLAVGAWWGPRWGLTDGRLIAFLFLVTIFLGPLAELSETFDLTQTAIAGWRKVLSVLDVPVDVPDPGPGVVLSSGPLGVHTEGLEFRYRDGPLVLRGIDVEIPAGSRIAIVGETGCGKTTFAKLLCRLADPSAGRIAIGGNDLRSVDARSRHQAIRMVPQDGFLFDTTVLENVRMGREEATDAEIATAFDDLGLRTWLDALPDGLQTVAGERGESLSVGERQFVALARAEVSEPGLLILDEATSAVDPEADQTLTEALQRLTVGRTTITIAHRLVTAERADRILVFDRGRIVEDGVHEDLARAGGVYAGLYDSWLGNTRADGAA